MSNLIAVESVNSTDELRRVGPLNALRLVSSFLFRQNEMKRFPTYRPGTFSSGRPRCVTFRAGSAIAVRYCV
jgi:hypothetical protein